MKIKSKLLNNFSAPEGIHRDGLDLSYKRLHELDNLAVALEAKLEAAGEALDVAKTNTYSDTIKRAEKAEQTIKTIGELPEKWQGTEPTSGTYYQVGYVDAEKDCANELQAIINGGEA